MKFGDRLKELRSERGITQQQLGEEIADTSNKVLVQQQIGQYESNAHEPDLEIITAFADYFDVSVDYMIGHSNIRTALTELEEYKLNPTEKSIVDIVRSYPDDYGDSVLQLLQVGVKYKK